MIDPAALERLEDAAVASLDGTIPGGLDILGYGEISTVLRADGVDGPVAAKRLPAMSEVELDTYRAVFERYLAALVAAGVRPVASELRSVGGDPSTPYCVQPLMGSLLVDVLVGADEATGRSLVDRLVETVAGAVTERLGLDGQVSNWAVDGGDLHYLDVTTPLLRDESGRELLDMGLFIASLPWALRGVVRRFLLVEILSHYYDPRAVLLDTAGNLYKERLDHLVPAFIEASNAVVDPPLTVDEARRYYRGDAAMWALLQRLRRVDRWWQRQVRRRRYPFLLPGEIER